jgi:hypothetical protein
VEELHPTLGRVVTWLGSQQPPIMDDFMAVVQNALEHISPVQAGQSDALALLIGRPIALARARVQLEMQGLPSLDHRWRTFRQEVDAVLESPNAPGPDLTARATAGVTRVTFPVRIGEFRQLDDGLVGYWIETSGADEDNCADCFHAPQTDTGLVDQPKFRLHQENQPANLLMSVDDPPQVLTVLVDPRGTVHATAGVLPTKAINIPADYWAETLRNLEVTFLSAPIVTDRGKIALPLPDAPGLAWSWLDREAGQWEHHPIGTADEQAAFAVQELREGWLQLKAAEPSDVQEG